MERFKVNRAPFNEALEHVRSILIRLHLNDGSIDHVASKRLPYQWSRASGRASIKIAMHRLLAGESVKRWRLVARPCRHQLQGHSVQAIAEKADARSPLPELGTAVTSLQAKFQARRRPQSLLFTTTHHHLHHRLPFDIPSLRHREQLTCS